MKNNRLLPSRPVPQTPWLLPEEHAWVVDSLYKLGLIKISEKRDLPLKSGGLTDVYINLREARNNPVALEFISDLFCIPLNRLQPDRFIEVPDSVSCFAGPLAIKTGIPYLTIRESEKAQRATNARIIGKSDEFENIVIIDDVITNGESKIIPYQECLKLRLNNQALIVLVDRQQGWPEHLAKAGVKMNVWPGLTLHDVRRELILSGMMTRCDPKMEEINPMIVALDGKSWEQILPVIDKLRTSGCILKVNDLLFGQGIDRLVPELSVYGRVMADLKGHDISNTVKNTCLRLKACPPWAVTVHASGGAEMVQAAKEALAGTPTLVLVITVLTSIDKETGEEIYCRQPLEQVMKLAEIGVRGGADGFVCSSAEVAMLKEKYPDKKRVVPGIRSEDIEVNDQKRVSTPQGAMDNGATNIVMGRQILNAKDPVAEVYRVMRDELHIIE